MNRAFLSERGITDPAIQKEILDAHQGVVQDLKDELKTSKNDLKISQTDLQNANTKISELQNQSTDPSSGDYKKKYEDETAAHNFTKETMQKKYDDFTASVEKEKINNTKKSALFNQLQQDGANPKLVDLLEKNFDLDAIELDGEKIKDWDNISSAVKEKYSDIFTLKDTEANKQNNYQSFPKFSMPTQSDGNAKDTSEFNFNFTPVNKNKIQNKKE